MSSAIARVLRSRSARALVSCRNSAAGGGGSGSGSGGGGGGVAPPFPHRVGLQVRGCKGAAEQQHHTTKPMPTPQFEGRDAEIYEAMLRIEEKLKSSTERMRRLTTATEKEQEKEQPDSIVAEVTVFFVVSAALTCTTAAIFSYMH